MMLPDLLWWLMIDLALVAGVALAAHLASCGRSVRRMWSSAEVVPPIPGNIVLFVPCKGAEPELEKNLVGLFLQRRVKYQLRFIVEDEYDAALPIIERLIERYPKVRSEVIIAGWASDSGQKVHNLRVATESLPDDCEVLAFADSDIRPNPLWLHSLTHVLWRKEVGASSGYRWFIPKRLTLPNLLVFSLNATAAACLGRRVFNLIWGGSWAIRREHFEQTGIRDAWRGTLNDDLVATRVIRGTPLRIDFEPRCMTASPLDMTWPQALNFIHRQLLQARYYATSHFWWGCAAILLQAIAFWCSAVLAIRSACWGEINTPAIAACAGLLALTALRSFVSHHDWKARFAEYEPQVRWLRRLEFAVGPLVILVAAFCVVRTCLSNTMVWRGMRYRLSGGGQTLFLGRQLSEDAAAAASGRRSVEEPRILPLPNRNAAA